MNKKELYTVGTVVMLKEGSKKLMITGYFPVVDNELKVYDYSGCLFPEGIISSDFNILFNHADIEKIIYEGHKEDPDAIKFNSQLDEYYSEIQDKIKEETSKEKDEEEIPFIEV